MLNPEVVASPVMLDCKGEKALVVLMDELGLVPPGG